MTINEAYRLVANLDYKESIRRFAPQHGLLHFNRNGDVESVYRYKTTPPEREKNQALAKHPGCLQIATTPHWFSSAKELQNRINQDLWLFSHMKLPPE